MSGKRMWAISVQDGSDWPWLVLLPTQDPGHLPLPHMQKHLQKKAMLGETWKLCLLTWVFLILEMVTFTFTSTYWQTPSLLQVYTGEHIFCQLSYAVLDFYSLHLISFPRGFWHNYASYLNPSQTMWNVNDLQFSLCSKGIAPRKQSPDFTPGLDISCFAGFQWVWVASISLKVEWSAWNHTSYLGLLGIVPSFSRSRWNNLGSGLGSMFRASDLLNSYY